MSSFNKFPWTNLHGFNLDWVIEKVQECISTVSELTQEIADISETYETKENITTQRKLSPTGNFTGTWWGDSKASVDAKILDGQNAYNEVLDLINSNPELNVEIIDGKFYLSTETIEEIDGGSYTDAVTDEIDCGLYIYPCQCQ